MFKATFQKSAKNSNFNRKYTFFVFIIFFDQFTHSLFFKNLFRKLTKFSLIFCIQNLKKFSAKKCLFLKINLAELAQGKKIVNFGNKSKVKNLKKSRFLEWY
jgi:hypothetical protein